MKRTCLACSHLIPGQEEGIYICNFWSNKLNLSLVNHCFGCEKYESTTKDDELIVVTRKTIVAALLKHYQDDKYINTKDGVQFIRGLDFDKFLKELGFLEE